MPFRYCRYTGNLDWLKRGIILSVFHGSHAYGTNIESSDIDIKGVAIPPKEYHYGLHSFEQAEFKDVQNDAESVVYDLRKFCKLAAECNPNIIEVLWVDPSDVFYVTSLGKCLIDSRELFLSKKAKHTFTGYAHSQLHRMMNHHRWLRAEQDMHCPSRSEYGLDCGINVSQDQVDAALSIVKKKLDHWTLSDMTGFEPALRTAARNKLQELLSEILVSVDDDLWRGAVKTLGFTTNFIELLEKEHRYNAAMKDYHEYLKWKQGRNPARAELERVFGYDTKHASHLVRLMRMCREILETGRVIVRRPDREELLAIRDGAWSLEQLQQFAADEELKLNELYKSSTLQHAPDSVKIERLMVSLIEEYLSRVRS